MLKFNGERHGTVIPVPRDSAENIFARSGSKWGVFLLTGIVCTITIMITCPSTIIFFTSLSLIILTLAATFQFAEAGGAQLYNAGTVESTQLTTDISPPDATAVIFAYLPNEQNIICETVTYFLHEKLYEGSLQVVLAYNTDRVLDVVKHLEEIQSKNSNFRILHVKNSKRKATNLNTILDEINTPIVGFFDADSRPATNSFSKACQWLIQGYDFVQGANNIGNCGENLLTRLTSLEFTLKYHGAYVGRYHTFGVSYFSGSNGYWRTDTVKTLKTNENAQVEDIDMAVRAMLQGAVLAYDPTILAYEEAPTTIAAWWRQRVRWAQGWAQLLIWHQANILKSDTMNTICKAVWCFVLFGRRFLLPWAFTVVLVGFFLHFPFENQLTKIEIITLSALFCVQLLGSVYVGRASLRSLISMNRCDSPNHSAIIIYSIIFPLYDVIRTLTILQGSLALMYTPVTWHCTPRRHERHSRRMDYDA